MAKLLTAIAVAAIKPGSARLEIRDTGSPGTGLFLHVQAKGKDGKSGGGKSWVMLIRDTGPGQARHLPVAQAVAWPLRSE